MRASCAGLPGSRLSLLAAASDLQGNADVGLHSKHLMKIRPLKIHCLPSPLMPGAHLTQRADCPADCQWPYEPRADCRINRETALRRRWAQSAGAMRDPGSCSVVASGLRNIRVDRRLDAI